MHNLLNINSFDNRVLSFYQEALELQNGTICKPRFALFYPTYTCNYNCTGCDYTELKRPPESAMLTGPEFQHALDEIVKFDIRAVELCGGGEPLLHPEIDTAIKFFHSAGVKVGLLTNGTEITDSRADLLVRACSYVRVSLEAGTEEVFYRVKRPASTAPEFSCVVENICKLLHSRSILERSCQISIKYTVDKNNTGDIENAVRLADKLGVDSIQFKCIRNVPSEISLEEKSLLNNSLHNLRLKYPTVKIVGNLLPHTSTVKCWLSPLHVMIDPFGDVFLCCYYRHRFDRHRYGNLLDSSLKDIWYSAEHKAALCNINKNECEKYDCRFSRYSELMAGLVDSGQLDFL